MCNYLVLKTYLIFVVGEKIYISLFQKIFKIQYINFQKLYVLRNKTKACLMIS